MFKLNLIIHIISTYKKHKYIKFVCKYQYKKLHNQIQLVVNIYIYIYVCVCVCVRARVYVRAYTRTRVCVCVRVCKYEKKKEQNIQMTYLFIHDNLLRLTYRVFFLCLLAFFC